MLSWVSCCDVTVDTRGCVQDGATPIYVAAYAGHEECIEVLARLGGDVNEAKTVSMEARRSPSWWPLPHVESRIMVLGVDSA